MVVHGPVERCCFDYHIFTTNSSPVTKYSKNDRIVNTHGGSGRWGGGWGAWRKTKKAIAFLKIIFKQKASRSFPRKILITSCLSSSRNPNSNKLGFQLQRIISQHLKDRYKKKYSFHHLVFSQYEQHKFLYSS